MAPQGQSVPRTVTTRGTVRLMLIVALAALLVGIMHPLRASAAEVLDVTLTQVTGTASFDADDLPGHDSGPNNDIVRTNDSITYNVTVTSNGGAETRPIPFTLNLPKGVVLSQIPAICDQAKSTLTPSYASIPTPGSAAEPLPLTATSWQVLPTQTLVCTPVQASPPNSSFQFPVVAQVRPEVPNGTALTASASASVDGVSGSSSPVVAIVSAKGQYDVSKNSVAQTPDTGYVYGIYSHPCSYNAARRCMFTEYPVLIAAPAGGKGLSPATDVGGSTFSFTDDLTPAAIYPPSAVSAANANLDKYGARLVSCANVGHYASPGRKINTAGPYGGLTTVNSVRDSGQLTCAQSGPGQPVTMKFSKVDASGLTCPTQDQQGKSLPATKCYVASARIMIDIPVDAIIDLGVAGTDGTTWTLATNNQFKNFTGTDIGGNTFTDFDPSNDHRRLTYPVTLDGSFTKYFSGVPGEPYNTPSTVFSQGSPYTEGPPGGATIRSGNITVLPGQHVLSTLQVRQNTSATQTTGSSLICDAWDTSKLNLRAANYPSAGTSGNSLPSGGAAVWLSGHVGIGGAGALPNSLLSNVVIEYGNGAGGSGNASKCDDGSSPGGWHTDPNDPAFGNDPTLAAQGVYSGVTRVRIYFLLAPAAYDQFVFFSVGLQVTANPGPIGTRVPNWASVKNRPANAYTFDQIRAASVPWNGTANTGSTYDPATHAGSPGDRLTVSEAYSRLVKKVWDPNTSTWVNGSPQYTGGQTVKYQLSPSLNAGVPTSLTRNVMVEDCLPINQNYIGATHGGVSVVPNVSAVVGVSGMPAGSYITCAAGETYLRWVLPDQQINAPITPIEVSAQVRNGSLPGDYVNHARVHSDGDQSAPSLLTAQATIRVVMPAGIYIDKQSLTPTAQVNRSDATTLQPLKWSVAMMNAGVDPGDANIAFIDVLPRGTVNGTHYSGDWTLGGVAVTDGAKPTQPVTLLYTKAANVDSNPKAASNLDGTVVWCDKSDGGTPVRPATASATDCPTNANVTAIEVVRNGSFVAGDRVAIEVTILPKGDLEGDVFVNRAQGTTQQRDVVGPVDAPEYIVAGSIGDYVWNDVNMNGVQDAGEPPVAGFTVRLNGTDDLGNTVALTTTTNADGYYHFTTLRSGTYKVTFDPASLQPGQHFTFANVAGGTAETDSDGNVATGEVTYTLSPGEHMADLDQGIFSIAPGVTIVKKINGDDANAAPGVAVDAGSTMQVTFDVTNTGDVPLTGVTLTDDKIAADAISCPSTTLAVGASMQCTASASAPTAAEYWVHIDTATVTGTPPAFPDGTQPRNVIDTDVANAHVRQMNLTLDKSAAAGPYAPGDQATFTLTPSNTGEGDAAAGWSVTEVLPAGLTLVSMSGDGYSCDVAAQRCTADAPLAAGATGAPITVVAAIGGDTAGSLRNVAYVAPAVDDVDETNPLVIPTSDTDADSTPTDNDAQASIEVTPSATTPPSTPETPPSEPPTSEPPSSPPPSSTEPAPSSGVSASAGPAPSPSVPSAAPKPPTKPIVRPPLAMTGLPADQIGWVAMALLLSGAVTAQAGRRRTRRQENQGA